MSVDTTSPVTSLLTFYHRLAAIDRFISSRASGVVNGRSVFDSLQSVERAYESAAVTVDDAAVVRLIHLLTALNPVITHFGSLNALVAQCEAKKAVLYEAQTRIREADEQVNALSTHVAALDTAPINDVAQFNDALNRIESEYSVLAANAQSLHTAVASVLLIYDGAVEHINRRCVELDKKLSRIEAASALATDR